MYKKIISFLYVCVTTLTLQAEEVPSVKSADRWKISGDICLGYVNFDYDNPPLGRPNIHQGNVDSKGMYIVPKISLLKPTYIGFSAKVTGAGITDFGINNPDYESGTLVYGAKHESFSILQEAYIQYENTGHKVLVGREEIDTPMISNDDWYFLANSFELGYYQNSNLDNITLSLGYVNKMSGVWDSGAEGTEFHFMSDASFVSALDKNNADDSGVSFLAFEYDNEIHSFSAWNYYAYDLYNTFFSQYDYANSLEIFSYEATLQYIDFQEVGELKKNNFTKIDYYIVSAQFYVELTNGFDFSTAVSKFSD